MFQFIRPDIKVDFVGKRHFFVAVSVIALAASIVLFFTKGLNYGIDFTGGAEVQIQVPHAWDIGKVRAELTTAGIKGLKVQEIGLAGEGAGAQSAVRQFLVKAQGDAGSLNQTSSTVEQVLLKTLKKGEYEIQRVDVVGPAAGSSLRMSGFLSMLYALICILIYVTIRFDFRYSPGAVIALFHDAVITLGIFIITQKQFDLQVLAAILALIGYSNNDTIIVYDRVRETTQQHPEMTIEQIVNKAINETLARTLLTSLTTFFTVFALWLLGGGVIRDFAFTLMVGIVVGTYSSVFIASTIVISLTHFYKKREARQKLAGAKA